MQNINTRVCTIFRNMKPRFKFLILCLCLLVFHAACRNSKSVLSVNEEKSKLDTTGNNEITTVKYRLIVSFYSRGSGINRQAKLQFDDLMKKYNYNFEIVKWGREGELDYCFKLDEIKSEEQAVFSSEVCSMLCNQQFIKITENTTCVHKR